MRIFITLLILWALSLGNKTFGQQQELMDALFYESGQINAKLPVVDSLYPYYMGQMRELKRNFQLSKQELAEIKRTAKAMKGEKLMGKKFYGAPLLDATLLWQFYRTGDSISMDFVGKHKPFYSISKPLFFDNGQKALIDVELIGGGGNSYLFIKRNGKWVLGNMYIRWVV